MLNSTDIEIKLRELSQRQCQILYLVCSGKTYKEVAAEIRYGEDLVTAEMSRIYRTFGLTQKKRTDKRRILEDMICPLHLQRVEDPQTDCREQLIEINAPPPDPADIQEVREDAKMGLIPLSGKMVYVGPSPQPQRPPQTGMSYGGSNSGSTSNVPAASKGNTGTGILIGVLVTLLIIACLLIGGFFAIGPQRVALLFAPSDGPTPAPGAALPQSASGQNPPSLVTPIAVIQTVVVTQAPLIQTVIATQAPVVDLDTPTPSVLDMSGKVPSDIPGMKLSFGTAVHSVVAQDTKPIDVYAVDLTAGKPLVVQVSVDGCLWVNIYNPGSKSIASKQYSFAYQFQPCNDGWQHSFIPAVSGTYYVSVEQRGIDPYTLRFLQGE